jgi:four helix bundle protein
MASFEAETQMILAGELGYISENQMTDFTQDSELIQKQIQALINRLRQK